MSAVCDAAHQLWLNYEGLVATVVGKALSPIVGDYFDSGLPYRFIHGPPHDLVAHLPLLRAITPLTLILTYLVVVRLGKAWIAGRIKSGKGAFKLKGFVLYYNIAMVALAFYMAARGWYEFFTFPEVGTFLDSPFSDTHQGLATLMWVFYASKLVEFMDTFIMVLKGNFRQVTFLHQYHHVSVTTLWWWAAAYAPTGNFIQGLIINSTVHVFMYGYYALRILGYSPPWKMIITVGQLTQFVFLFLQGVYLLHFQPTGTEFHHQPTLVKLMLCYMASFIILFGNYFIQEYVKKSNAGKRKAEEAKKLNAGGKSKKTE